MGALLCVAAFIAAGCHGQGDNSFYGVSWVTVTSEPGATSSVTASPRDFTSYIVDIDSITLTRSDGVVVTALATAETVDFTKLSNVSELWGTATIPNGTYTSATITLDYTSAVITVMVNGVPTVATVVNPQNMGVTTMSITVTFDPVAGQPIVTPTYASTSAERLALNFDLAASGYVIPGTSPPKVVVNPFFTAGVLPADSKLIRVRGPLINTNVNIGTYTTYIRPFHDETSALGTVSMFNTASTIYSINGVSYTGIAGVNQFSLLSAGTTMTASYTTFTPTLNTLNNAAAGIFNPVYVVGGSTLEDVYTEGLGGEVIARSGDTLTLRGSTLFLNTADEFIYETADTQVLLGTGTTVTADDTTFTGLTSADVAVGQQIEARGIYSVLASGEVQLDSTGTSATNTGSVRLLPTQLYGPLVSSGAGTLTMDLQNIDDYPVSIYNFAGNGATATPTPTAFTVNTGTLAVPAGTVAGDPLWVNGLFAPYGSAPPDFTATAVNSEYSVQVAGSSLTAAPGSVACGVGSQVCVPASLRVFYDPAVGTLTPFTTFTDSGFSVDLTNTALASAVIRIGPELIDLKTLPTSPQIVPTGLVPTSTFSPLFSYGDPSTATVTPTVTTATTSIMSFSSFPTFVSKLPAAITAASPVLQMTAYGVYDRANNYFYATSVNVVL